MNKNLAVQFCFSGKKKKKKMVLCLAGAGP